MYKVLLCRSFQESLGDSEEQLETDDSSFTAQQYVDLPALRRKWNLFVFPLPPLREVPEEVEKYEEEEVNIRLRMMH